MGHEAGIDALICERVPRGCTLCGHASLTYAGLWDLDGLGVVYVFCKRCETTMAESEQQLERLLRQRYADYFDCFACIEKGRVSDGRTATDENGRRRVGADAPTMYRH